MDVTDYVDGDELLNELVIVSLKLEVITTPAPRLNSEYKHYILAPKFRYQLGFSTPQIDSKWWYDFPEIILEMLSCTDRDTLKTSLVSDLKYNTLYIQTTDAVSKTSIRGVINTTYLIDDQIVTISFRVGWHAVATAVQKLSTIAFKSSNDNYINLKFYIAGRTSDRYLTISESQRKLLKTLKEYYKTNFSLKTIKYTYTRETLKSTGRQFSNSDTYILLFRSNRVQKLHYVLSLS